MEAIGIIGYLLGYILGLHRGYSGIMENKMETTIQGLGFGVKGPRKQIAGF